MSARRAALPALALAGAATAAVVVHVLDPATGAYPTCPFLALTGWWCPGCGSLRAVHALSDGDLGTALARNPATVLAVLVSAALWAQWARASVTGTPLRVPRVPPWLAWTMLVALPAWWVARNVPGWTWLSPA